jgi:hypothetical protein
LEKDTTIANGMGWIGKAKNGVQFKFRMQYKKGNKRYEGNFEEWHSINGKWTKVKNYHIEIKN